MTNRFAYAPPLLLMILAFSAVAQTPPAAPSPMATTGLVRVSLRTTAGVIVLDLESKRAPITAANFLRYVDQKRFDGTVFYRAMKLGDGSEGLIQGGTQNAPKRILKPIAHEPTSLTGVKHEVGAISMARYAPGTATGDFSILVSAMPGLDANPAQSGDNAGYAAFGRVVGGFDIVRKIHAMPTSPTLGEGFLKGQMLAAPVKILSVHRVHRVHIANANPPVQ
jgi:peptidyl-prolyl cis-trans isomerase A (cyclophilin A)